MVILFKSGIIHPLSLGELLIFFFMGLFSGLFEVAKLPFSVAADVATMGFRVVEEGQSFTGKKCEEIDNAFRD